MKDSARATPPRPAAIRTFLIADIRGYTRFTAEHGDEAASRLARKFAEIADEGVEAWGGTIVELRGDEALAVFDSARQSLRAAVELQVAFAAESGIQPELPLGVGIGLDAGEAAVIGDGYRGAALNIAARLCAVAAAGEIVASQQLASLAGPMDGIEYRDQGSMSLKGVERPMAAVSVVGTTPQPAAADVKLGEQTAQPPLPAELDSVVPMAGRKSDLQWLAWHWRRAGHGAGRAVVISGPPGMGKTRLATELATRAHADGAAVAYLPAAREIGSFDFAEIGRADLSKLVIVDDLDAAPMEQAKEVASLAGTLAGRRVLLLVTHREEAAPTLIKLVDQFAAADRRRELAPLEPDAVRQIAALYAGRAVDSLPLEEIAAESAGLPAAVHRLASSWARRAVAERLVNAARDTSAGRRGLRAAEADLIANVTDLELARERAELYGADRPRDGLSATPRADICPYKGLAAFEAADADYYFGRERLVAELVARLVGSSFLGLVGASGSGKSSALRAGLLPALAGGVLPGSDSWPQVVLRPGEQPLAELGQALARAMPERDLPADDPPAALKAVVDGLPAGGRLVLVVDQFEEAFNATRDETERQAFIDLLTGERDGLKVVVAMRADHYGHCAAYPELARLIGTNQVLVGPLTRPELAAVVEHPAQRVGLAVEPGLTDALLDDIGDEPGALPLISTALLELWQARDHGRLTLAAYHASGGVRGAVARLAEAAYAALDDGQRLIARSIFLRLAGPGEGEGVVRRRVSLGELDAERDAAVAGVLAALTDARLLTTGEGYVEVAHEALLREWPRLQDWLEEDAAGRQLRLHLIEAAVDWNSHGREPGDLYRGARLAAALDWAPGHDVELNALEREFLDESRQASEREAERQRRTNRRLRLLLAGAGVFLIVAVGAGLFAAYQAQIAAQAGEFARSRELAASAIAVLGDDPTLSKLLSLSAASIADPPIESFNSLHQAWAADRVVYRYQWPADRGEVTEIYTDIDSTGRYVVASGFWFLGLHDYLEVADRDTGNVLWSFDPSDETVAIGHAFFTLDGRQVVGGAYREQALPDGSVEPMAEVGVHVWDATTGDLIRRWDVGPCGAVVVAVSESNALIRTSLGASCIDLGEADAQRNIALEVVDLESGERTPLSSRADLIDEGALSRDGRWVAFDDLTDAGPETVIVDLETGARRALDLEGGGVRDLNRDGSLLVSGSWPSPLRVWDPASGEMVAELAGHTGGTSYIEFTPDGRTLYSTGSDSTLRGWDALSGKQVFEYPAILNGRPAATGTGLVLVGHWGTPLSLLVDTGLRAEFRAVAAGRTPEEEARADNGCFVDAGRLQVIDGIAAFQDVCGRAGATGTTRVIDLDALQQINTVPSGTSFALSPDGKRLAHQAVRDDGNALWTGPIKILDSRTGAELAKLEGLCTYDQSPVKNVHLPDENDGCRPFPEQPFPILGWQLRWSPDGNMIAVVDGYDAYYAVWDARDGRLVTDSQRLGQPGRAFDVIFTPDSAQLIASSRVRADEAQWFFDRVSTATWTLERSHPAPAQEHNLSFVGFSADGTTVATVSDFRGTGGGALHWIDVETLEQARPSRPRLHDGQLWSVGISPDRSTLATGSGDGVLRVWDAATGRLEHEISFPPGVDGLAFVADTRLAVLLGDDANLRLVTVDEDELLRIVRESLTRGFTEAECERFNFDVCPTLEELAGD